MKIALKTLGCKLNQAETDTLARKITAMGHELVTVVEDADVFILNTCTVTRTADAKARHLLSRARRRKPGVFIVATGCYVQSNPTELAKYVDLEIDNDDKANLLAKLVADGVLPQPESVITATTLPALRTRAFVKIQDGCTNYCTFCIVPYVRRGEKSLPVDEIIATVKNLVREGCQEVVLTGTRIGGYNDNGTDFTKLTQRVLHETTIKRIRVSSLQPQEIVPDLLNLWRNSRMCPHIHLSLQSGSKTVLKRMNRRYTLTEFEKTVKLIREMIPAVAITTDVIVGFPGETDAEFKESMAFCRKIDFARIHVFIFSPRVGTKASTMPGQVSDKIKRVRSQNMLALAQVSADKFRGKFTGELVDVLWEKQEADGKWSGVTGNYIRVYKTDKKNIRNQVGLAKLS